MKRKTILVSLIFVCAINLLYSQASDTSSALEQKTDNFLSMLNSDSISWNMAKAELERMVMFDMYCLCYPDSAYANLYVSEIDSTYFHAGKFREDLNTGQLWYENLYNAERLLMDMSLSVGDTFEVYMNEWSTVEDVYYRDGRKIIQFDWYSTMWKENLLFIEGVGRNIGFLYGDYLFYTSCKYDNDQLVYVNQNTLFIGCFLDPTNVDESTAQKAAFSITQHAGSKQLRIAGVSAFNKPIHLKVVNILGNKTSEYTLSNDPDSVDLSHLENGVYVLVFSSIDRGEILDVKKIYLKE